MSDAFPSDPYPGIAVPPPFGTPFEVRKALETMRADAVANISPGLPAGPCAPGGAPSGTARWRPAGRLAAGVGGGGAARWLQQAAPPTEPPVSASTALTPVAPAPAAFSASDAAAVFSRWRARHRMPRQRRRVRWGRCAGEQVCGGSGRSCRQHGAGRGSAGGGRQAVPARRARVAAAGKQGASNGRRTSTRAASSAAVGPAASIHRAPAGNPIREAGICLPRTSPTRLRTRYSSCAGTRPARAVSGPAAGRWREGHPQW